jgi:GBP family porin
MKKFLLAIGGSGVYAISVHAQSSVTLYGLVYTNNQGGHTNWQEVSSATQNTVFGLKGSEDLGGGLHAIVKLEQGFNLNNGSEAFPGDGFGSQAWAGVQSDAYGKVTFCRQFDMLNDLLGPLTAESTAWDGNIARIRS